MHRGTLVATLAVLGCSGVSRLPSVVPAAAPVAPRLGRALADPDQFIERSGARWHCPPTQLPCVGVELDAQGQVERISWYHSGPQYDSLRAALVRRYGTARNGFSATGGEALMWVEATKRMCVLHILGFEEGILLVLERRAADGAAAQGITRMSPGACDEIT